MGIIGIRKEASSCLTGIKKAQLAKANCALINVSLF